MFCNKNLEKLASNRLIGFENYSQNQTHLNLSKHPLFRFKEKANDSKNTFSFFESDDQIITTDEARIMAEVLRGIPSWFTHLNLNYNGLGERTMEELIIILGARPENIRHLKLKDNSFYLAGFNRINEELTGFEAFRQIIDSLSSHYISVDLDNNGLGMMDIEKLIYLVSTISPDLETLKLRYNCLGYFSDENLVKLFGKFPAKLKYFYMAGNAFFKDRYDKAIISILNALPDSIVYLDFMNNLSSFDSKIELEERIGNIYPELKPNIQYALSCRLKKNEFMMQKIDYMLFKNTKSYENNLAYRPQLAFEISESRLEKLVHGLEKRNDLPAFFIAGLLLEGRVPAQIKRDFSASELRVYCEKRMHDAISLYIKSGQYMHFPAAEMQVLNIVITKHTASVIQHGLITSNSSSHDRQLTLITDTGQEEVRSSYAS